MKATKTFLVLSIAMILFGLTALAGKPTIKPEVQRGTIKYLVNIHVPVGINISDVQLYVLITDKHNRKVALPQQFSFETMTYVFFEEGPVTGTRIAWIMQSNNDGPKIQLWGNNDIKTGTFLPGHLYQFDIYPGTGKPDLEFVTDLKKKAVPKGWPFFNE
ncbi:MAG: hypothetical protein NTX61_13965 [Bacteroidetes bacterium]|nr:hypothetical protein [Bacteroidota bacterium]